MAGKDSYRVGVLDRCHRILNHLADTQATVQELAQALDMDAATVYRLVRDMEGRGFLRRTANKRYCIGWTLYQLGQNALNGLEWHSSREHLTVLANTTACSAGISVRSELDARCLERVYGPGGLRIILEVGSTTPLHATAQGKVLLAFSSATFREAYLATSLRQFTPKTLTDPGQLRAALEQIAEDGYAFSWSELYPEAAGLAVPLRDRQGAVVAALSIGGTMTTISSQRDEILVELLYGTAAAITASEPES